jgi:hypothetical protein
MGLGRGAAFVSPCGAPRGNDVTQRCAGAEPCSAKPMVVGKRLFDPQNGCAERSSVARWLCTDQCNPSCHLHDTAARPPRGYRMAPRPSPDFLNRPFRCLFSSLLYYPSLLHLSPAADRILSFVLILVLLQSVQTPGPAVRVSARVPPWPAQGSLGPVHHGRRR